jgi:Flp pilus assembly protein TadD
MNRNIKFLLFFIFPSVALSLLSYSQAQQSSPTCYVFKSGEVKRAMSREACEMNRKEVERYREVFLRPSPEIKTLLDKASQAMINGDDDLAISFWTQALNKSSKTPEALLRRGSTLIVKGRYRQGYKDFKQLEKLLKQEGFSQEAEVISKMIKDTQAEYVESGINLNN